MTALSTAETALRRMPDDRAVPVTLTGAEAVAVVAELDRLRRENDLMRDAEYRRSDQLRRLGDEMATAGEAVLYGPGPLERRATYFDRLGSAVQSWKQVGRA